MRLVKQGSVGNGRDWYVQDKMAMNLHPRDLLRVRELEDEFVDDAINTDSSANELQLGIGGVTENEAIAVEIRELFAAYATSELLYARVNVKFPKMSLQFGVLPI